MLSLTVQQMRDGRDFHAWLGFTRPARGDFCIAIVGHGDDVLVLMKSLTHGGGARIICAAAFCLTLFAVALSGSRAHAADDSFEARKQPMTFKLHAAQSGVCTNDCRDWIAAAGIITADTPALFDEFAQGRDLRGVRIMLDSSGGSVIDTIEMGRTWRSLGVHTSVGAVTERSGEGRVLQHEASCESMCVFLLLSGATRDVSPQAHVRVHQIWMGDRAADPRAATYSAEDLMIVEHDIGQLVKYTFDMGGSGDLLALTLSVPPWQPLHELTSAQLRASRLITDEAIADSAPKGGAAASVAANASVKPIQDRLVHGGEAAGVPSLKPTTTADAQAPTGGMAVPVPAPASAN